MIHTYKPTAIQRAAQEIKHLHPLRTADDEEPVTQEDTAALVRDIAASPKSGLTMMALSVSPRQLRTLCAALPKLKNDVEKEKVSYVLDYNMNTELFGTLFTVWQSSPLSEPVLKLLADHENRKHRPDNFPLPRGVFSELLPILPQHDEYIRAVSQRILPAGLSVSALFTERYKQTTLKPGTTLYAYCFITYLADCDAAVFEAEGDEAVSKAISLAGNTRSAESIILNLLARFADDPEGLLPFRKCYPLIAERYEYPDRAVFADNTAAFLSYRWLHRYYRLAAAFEGDADRKRMLFWTHYLKRCELTVYEKVGLLVLEFKDYCVVESMTTGPLFIYEKDYFENSVKNRLAGGRSNVRNWLSKNSKYVYTLGHNINWESRVRENAAQYLV